MAETTLFDVMDAVQNYMGVNSPNIQSIANFLTLCEDDFTYDDFEDMRILCMEISEAVVADIVAEHFDGKSVADLSDEERCTLWYTNGGLIPKNDRLDIRQAMVNAINNFRALVNISHDVRGYPVLYFGLRDGGVITEVTYWTDYGTEPTGTRLVSGTITEENLPTLTAEGYVHTGWVTDLGDPVTVGDTFEYGPLLRAVWEEAAYEPTPLPEEYTQLEYLEGTGTQVIDTGIPANDNTGMLVEIEPTEYRSGKVLIGARANGNRFWFGQALLGWNVMSNFALSYLPTNVKTLVSFNYMNSREFACDGVVVANFTETLGTNGNTIAVFCGHDTNVYNNNTPSKVYSLKISVDNSIVGDFVPVKRNSDGELGLYDLVNDTFHTNIGTGTFVGGERDNYLTFSSESAFTITTANTTKNWDGILYYSTNTLTWSEWDGVSTIASAEHAGEYRIYMCGSGNTVISGANTKGFTITGSNVRCDGNIESLLDYETVQNGEHPTMASSCYRGLFMGNKALASAPELPAMTLVNYCYHSMFRDCSNLKEAPELPATTLANDCYPYIFSGCTSLTKAPSVLPALEMKSSCYHSLLAKCTSLTHAPKILAETLAYNCFMYMFSGCNSLITLPKLHAQTLAQGCYQNMFNGCANIKLSTEKTEEYTTPYSIPYAGVGTDYEGAMKYMFDGTGGTVKGAPSINTVYYTSNLVDGEEYVEPMEPYLTFTSENEFSIEASQEWDGALYYSFGDDIWIEWDGSTIQSRNVLTGSHTIYFRGSGNTIISSESSWYIDGEDVRCIGNIETLLDYEMVQNGEHPEMGEYCFANMFEGCTSLTQAPELPATELTPCCYCFMFSGCTSLTQAPELPSTTLAYECYFGMFIGCESLTQAPALPATELATECYLAMFSDCISLTQAPELPATTLANYCYQSMFSSCASLTQAPELPATTLAEYCYTYMFNGCISLTQAPELPATELADKCYQYMFAGCTSLTQAPELPATTLANGCYDSMFYGCMNLTQAPELPATTLATDCYRNMFTYCISLTQAPELPATELTQTCYYYMFSSCESLIQAPELPATTLSVSCYNSMFKGCIRLTQAPELPATTLANNCYHYMFQGCTNLTQAPELPATELSDKCYQYMFSGCRSLTQAPELPATTLANYCYQNMFANCTSLTQAPELPATTLANNCYNAMFKGCTGIKVSTEQSDEYPAAYRIPSTGDGTTADNALKDMFSSTGGTFKGTPEINTTYYGAWEPKPEPEPEPEPDEPTEPENLEMTYQLSMIMGYIVGRQLAKQRKKKK